jgi:hypothetical protein
MDVTKIAPSPYGIQTPTARSIVRSRQWESFDTPESGAVTAARAAENPETEVLSSAEKSFFEQMFPAAADEIRSYHAYQRTGIQPTTNVGTMIDRKG